MFKLIARLAATAVAAGALALGMASTAGAVIHFGPSPVDGCTAIHGPLSCGTFGSTGGRFLAEVGSPQRVASSGVTKFSKQTGVEAETSFWIFTNPDGSLTLLWSDAGTAEGRTMAVAEDPAGNLFNSHLLGSAAAEWNLVGTRLVNVGSGDQLILNNHGGASAGPNGSDVTEVFAS